MFIEISSTFKQISKKLRVFIQIHAFIYANAETYFTLQISCQILYLKYFVYLCVLCTFYKIFRRLNLRSILYFITYNL